MIDFLKRLAELFGFQFAPVCNPPRPEQYDWALHPFFTEEKRRNERLAQIARERDALKEQLAKAIKDKKARAPIYAKLRALSVEELRVETGK